MEFAFVYVLGVILCLVFFIKVVIPIKDHRRIVAKSIKSISSYTVSEIITVLLLAYNFSISFGSMFKSTYNFIYPKYINSYWDMFNYDKLSEVYNTIRGTNYYVADIVYNYLSLAPIKILEFYFAILILLVLMISGFGITIYEDWVYIHGIKYKLDDVTNYNWSERKSLKRFGRTIEYYELNLCIKRKFKIFDEEIMNPIIKIKSEDKVNVNTLICSHLNKFEI